MCVVLFAGACGISPLVFKPNVMFLKNLWAVEYPVALQMILTSIHPPHHYTTPHHSTTSIGEYIVQDAALRLNRVRSLIQLRDRIRFAVETCSPSKMMRCVCVRVSVCLCVLMCCCVIVLVCAGYIPTLCVVYGQSMGQTLLFCALSQVLAYIAPLEPAYAIL